MRQKAPLLSFVLTVIAGLAFAAVDPPIAVRLARAVLDNADALWREIRETGDLLWGLHACENDRGVPGGGLVPWRDIFTALKSTKAD